MGKKTIATIILSVVMGACGALAGCGTPTPQAEAVTVSFDTGTEDVFDAVVLEPGEVYGELPVLERKYYEFLGWELPATDNTDALKITENSKVIMTTDHTLYAKWQFVGTGNITASTMAVGYTHALILDDDGYIWTWGTNYEGQLGDGTNEDRIAPEKLQTEVKFKKVFAYHHKSYAIDENDNVWAWGREFYGLPVNEVEKAPRNIPTIRDESTKYSYISTPMSIGAALDTENNLYLTYTDGYDRSMKKKVATGIIKGEGHLLRYMALTTDNELLAYGSNGYGQFGNGTTESNKYLSRIMEDKLFIDFSNIDTNILAIDTDGNVWSCGRNKYGQLGDGKVENSAYPVHVDIPYPCIKTAICDRNGYALDIYNNLWAWGLSFDGQKTIMAPRIITDIKVESFTISDDGVIILRDTQGKYWGYGSSRLGFEKSPDFKLSPIVLE